jgi:hypothetical protein
MASGVVMAAKRLPRDAGYANATGCHRMIIPRKPKRQRNPG